MYVCVLASHSCSKALAVSVMPQWGWVGQQLSVLYQQFSSDLPSEVGVSCSEVGVSCAVLSLL